MKRRHHPIVLGALLGSSLALAQRSPQPPGGQPPASGAQVTPGQPAGATGAGPLPPGTAGAATGDAVGDMATTQPGVQQPRAPTSGTPAAAPARHDGRPAPRAPHPIGPPAPRAPRPIGPPGSGSARARWRGDPGATADDRLAADHRRAAIGGNAAGDRWQWRRWSDDHPSGDDAHVPWGRCSGRSVRRRRRAGLPGNGRRRWAGNPVRAHDAAGAPRRRLRPPARRGFRDPDHHRDHAAAPGRGE